MDSVEIIKSKDEKQFIIETKEHLLLLTYAQLSGALQVLKRFKIDYRVMEL